MKESDIENIINSVKTGGSVLGKYFGQVLKTEQKSTLADFRTKADIESESVIVSILEKEFPTYNILSEEKGFIDHSSVFTFVLDPLDGTNNFVLGIPYIAVSLALLKNKEIIFSVIYNPILNQIYWAQKNKGAFLNKNKLSVNDEVSIKKATISYVCGYKTPPRFGQEIVKKLDTLGVKRKLSLWCPALDFCLLASGKIESIINDNEELYDFLPGKLIAREAGAILTNFKGEVESDDKNFQFIVSNNKKIQQKMLTVV